MHIVVMNILKKTVLDVLYMFHIFLLSIFAIQMTSGMPCTPAIPHWVWGPSTIKAVKRRESVLFGI